MGSTGHRIFRTFRIFSTIPRPFVRKVRKIRCPIRTNRTVNVREIWEFQWWNKVEQVEHLEHPFHLFQVFHRVSLQDDFEYDD